MPNQTRLLPAPVPTLTPEEEALRASYRASRRAHLQDPGFSLGDDEAIPACAIVGKANLHSNYGTHLLAVGNEYRGNKLWPALLLLWTVRSSNLQSPDRSLY